MALLYLLCVLTLAVVASAHPSAIGGGRASCGAEYETEGTAYHLPDIRESCVDFLYNAVYLP